VEYAVPPLALAEAVELFCARAQLEPDATIFELCRRLESLPLAVELAAARMSALSPAQILERLATRLDLLEGGRDAEARQQTLRSTIEWSYDLLAADEQRLVARLERDHDHLRATFDHLETSGESQEVLGLAGALRGFWGMRGFVSEGWRRLEGALLADERRTAARARALNGAADLGGLGRGDDE